MTKIQKKGLFTPKKVAPLDTLGIVTPNVEKQRETYQKRQLAKAITMAQLFPLIDLNSKLKDSYWDTYHCNKTIVQEGYKFRSSYCDARWCTLCNRIRMAKMINGYSVPILKFKDPQFLTLTAPNVGKGELRKEFDRMMATWRKMTKTFNKYHKPLELKGIRKIECTYNPHTGFNPHFHIIVDGKEVAEVLLKLWMKHNPKSNMGGQKILECYGKENMLVELFKYVAKAVHKGKFHAEALDEIYQAMYYRKTYYPMKIKKVVEENIEGIKSENITFKGFENEIWEYNWEIKNWVSKSGGELLTNYILDGKLDSWIEELAAREKGKRKVPLPKIKLHKWTKNIGKD